MDCAQELPSLPFLTKIIFVRWLPNVAGVGNLWWALAVQPVFLV